MSATSDDLFRSLGRRILSEVALKPNKLIWLVGVGGLSLVTGTLLLGIGLL